MEQLLIVEDDRSLNTGLTKALQAESRKMVSCYDLKTAREQLMCGGTTIVYVKAVFDTTKMPSKQGLFAVFAPQEALFFMSFFNFQSSSSTEF